MALASGTCFGPYEVVEQIGSGGMGEVWRARDTELNRDVAVKVLPRAFVDDADRLARFKREAEVLASLNHANIATIHGLEKADGQTIIVMELVEGPTLADRLEAGPIPPDEALSIARQIADALEAAHANQIVHRDLKPANVKLRADGMVKVLDFGISKTVDPTAISGSPMMTTPAVTETGVILGTAAYMSPEQARGKFVDQRTDIWAFGCLLFEMLTGQPAFGGEDVMLTLARVLDRDTDMSSMPGTISPAVRQTIKLCLEKDPRKRIADIRDVRLAIEGAFNLGDAPASRGDVAPDTLSARALPFVAGLLVAAVVVGGVSWALRPQPVVEPVNRFSQAVPSNLPFDGTAYKVMDVAPDGRSFVFNTPGGLYLRAMGELEARLIAGSEARSAEPVFSPDSSSLVYFNRDSYEFRKIPVSGGAPVPLGRAASPPFGVSWGQDDELLFGSAEGIFRLSATGGTPDLLIAASAGERFFHPQRLPDGDAILFSVTRFGLNFETAQVVVQSPSSSERTVLVNGGSDARYLTTGHLVYGVGGDLFAVAFDAEALTVDGGAVPILQGVLQAEQTPATNFAVANDGTLVYIPGDAQNTSQLSLVWVDRDGNEEPFGLPPRNYGFTRLSPDGERIATLIAEAGGTEIWKSDVSRPVLTRVTSSERPKFLPLWSPEGDRIVTTSSTGGPPTMWWTLADATGELETLMTMEEGSTFLSAESWSKDGEIVFTYGSVQEPRIGLLDLEPDDGGERSWRPLIDRSYDASMLAVSPQGGLIAYQSADTGHWEVYIEQFPGLGNKVPVSTDPGGWAPAWSPAGDEIYYRRLSDGAMMVASVRTSPSLEIGTPEVLFESQGYLPLVTPQAGGAAGREWDVAPNGRFLMVKANTTADSSDVIIVQHWAEELARQVPGD